VSNGTSLVSSTTMTSASMSPSTTSDFRHSCSDCGRFLVTTPTVRRGDRISGMDENLPFGEGACVDGERGLCCSRPTHVADLLEGGVCQARAQRRIAQQPCQCV